MSFPIPTVYEHIKQLSFQETDDAIICAKMTEYAQKLISEKPNTYFGSNPAENPKFKKSSSIELPRIFS